MYIHGGGWTLGSIATYDSVARVLANQVPAVVVLVDYRLAPEFPFPAALEDSRLTIEWAIRNAADLGGDPGRLVLAGDSAGGTLATVCALTIMQQGIPVALQVLFYPSTNISRTDSASFQEYGEGYLLTKKAVESFRCFYLPNRQDWQRPDVSPLLLADEELRQMPPALVVTAGCDPLRDEGEAYANRLRASGIPVTYHVEEEMIHAFLSFFNAELFAAISPLVEPILSRVAQDIRRELGGTTD